MALYHFHVEPVSRADGRSAVACAAYRSGEKLVDEYYGTIQDYTRKQGVLHSEISLPGNAPTRFADRETLWNELEQIEKHPKAQLMYSFDFALQNEFSYEENLALARSFIQENFVDEGMICDWAIHNPDKGENGIPNPHVHVLVPIRPLTPDGAWGNKQHREYLYDENGDPILDEDGKHKFNAVAETDWGTPEKLLEWRKNWADAVNAIFEEKGLPDRIDHRSNVDQGLDQLPTIHEGPKVRAMEARGIETERGNYNRMVKAFNKMLTNAKSIFKGLIDTISEIKKEIAAEEAAMKEASSKRSELGDYLISYMEKRNAGAYSQKAKANNAKLYGQMLLFIKEHDINSIDDLMDYASAAFSRSYDAKHKLKGLETKLKSLDESLRHIDAYEAGKPIHEKKGSFRLESKRNAFYESHRAELTLFYTARRILKERFPEAKNYSALRKPLLTKREKLLEEIAALSPEVSSLEAESKLAFKFKQAILETMPKEKQHEVEHNKNKGAR